MKAETLRQKSLPELLSLAERKFNKFIRTRDEGQGCICCNGKQYNEMQAGHFYSGGHYPNLRFNEDNVNSQGKSCNYYKSGNLIEYRKGLEKKIGEMRLKVLDIEAENYKMYGFKWDKEKAIEIILKY